MSAVRRKLWVVAMWIGGVGGVTPPTPEERHRMLDDWIKYEKMCKQPVAQDSHCVLESGHDGECIDNMGWTQTMLKRAFGG